MAMGNSSINLTRSCSHRLFSSLMVSMCIFDLAAVIMRMKYKGRLSKAYRHTSQGRLDMLTTTGPRPLLTVGTLHFSAHFSCLKSVDELYRDCVCLVDTSFATNIWNRWLE
jgi:hypothetical protein